MSSLLEMIGQFVAVLVAAAFMHFGAMLSDAVDKDTTNKATSSTTSETVKTEPPTEIKTVSEERAPTSNVTNTTVSSGAKSQAKVPEKS